MPLFFIKPILRWSTEPYGTRSILLSYRSELYFEEGPKALTSSRIDAVVKAIAAIEDIEFEAYQGGWRNEIGTALVDAVYSIRAKYNASDPAKGVSGRVRAFREKYPETRNNLSAVAKLGEERIREVMGNTKTGRRPKSVCVVEAAQTLMHLAPPIVTADDALSAGTETVTRAYTSVKGLGPVTAEYFQMHLGVPGVKADRMIIRFGERALLADGLEEALSPGEARDLIINAYEIDPRGAANLSAFEHAIWRVESAGTLTKGCDE